MSGYNWNQWLEQGQSTQNPDTTDELQKDGLKIEFEFINVKDRLPEVSGDYLVKLPLFITTLYYDKNKGQWFYQFGNGDMTEPLVTHWASLSNCGAFALEPYSPEWFEYEMRECRQDNDTESGHIKADELMCALLKNLGYENGIRIFEEMKKWYS